MELKLIICMFVKQISFKKICHINFFLDFKVLHDTYIQMALFLETSKEESWNYHGWHETLWYKKTNDNPKK
jgi:hypothetical protein